MTSPPTPGLHDRLVDVARLRLGLPRGQLSGEIMPFWPDEFEGLWVLRVLDGEAGRVVVVMTRNDDIEAHAGLGRAAARLRDLRLLERPDPHPTESLRPLLDAVGGLTPGYPRYPTESVERTGEGGSRVTLFEPIEWVRFAAAGGAGMPPAEIMGSRGVSAPPACGRMVCELDPSYRLSWTYEIDGQVVGGFAANPDDDLPDEAPPLLAERLITAARRQARAPFGVPSGPVHRSPGGATGDWWSVDLLGVGPVEVALPELGG